MITLTTEQAQQIEEALEDIVRVFKFETGTPVEALAVIRAARAQEQAEQEPVGRWNWNEGKFEWLTKFDYHKHHMTPLYAAPVQQVDLTDDEIDGIANNHDDFAGRIKVDHVFDFARAVLAAYKEKNK